MDKYKIFIIDDEPMIVKGLQTLVPWEDINCEISGTARNGEQGLELITNNPPDIVISDIRMPKLSGLGMIERIKKTNEGIKFIILTGHRDFEYAQKAINLGVIKYLLKPTNLEDIKEAVLEAMMILDEEHSKLEDIEKLREKLNLSVNSPVADIDQNLESSEILDHNSNQGPSDDTSSGEHKIKFLAVQAVNYMKANYDKKLDLQRVADQLYISTWYLCKVLKQEMDNSFVQLLNEIRIQEAKALLTETTYKVYEICEMVGYQDTPYFTKTFKKHTGMTPNQYRNEKY